MSQRKRREKLRLNCQNLSLLKIRNPLTTRLVSHFASIMKRSKDWTMLKRGMHLPNQGTVREKLWIMRRSTALILTTSMRLICWVLLRSRGWSWKRRHIWTSCKRSISRSKKPLRKVWAIKRSISLPKMKKLRELRQVSFTLLETAIESGTSMKGSERWYSWESRTRKQLTRLTKK